MYDIKRLYMFDWTRTRNPWVWRSRSDLQYMHYMECAMKTKTCHILL